MRARRLEPFFQFRLRCGAGAFYAARGQFFRAGGKFLRGMLPAYSGEGMKTGGERIGTFLANIIA